MATVPFDKLKPRGKTMRWLSTHRGCYEIPAGSNGDNRKDGITVSIRLIGFSFPVPWCGVWVWRGLRAAGVLGISSRQASVSLIEQDAKAHRAPYGRGWITTRTPGWVKKVLRGDSVVLFGSGVHVETVRSTAWIYRVRGYIITDGGNTTAEAGSGSQSDGGTSARRKRPISSIYGFGLVNFPDR